DDDREQHEQTGPPPGGGYGPPGEPPDGGGPGRRTGLLVLLAVIVAVGVIAAVFLVATGDGNGGGDGENPDPSATKKPTPSLSIPSELPTGIPTDLPTGLPTGFPTDLPTGLPTDIPTALPTDFASPAGDETPYFLLAAGDCFDVGTSAQGYAVRKSCTSAHDAEVVKIAELEGTYGTEQAIRSAASKLCQGPLDTKAAKQPAGTVRGTLVQYPDPTGFQTGIDSVACSLSGDTKAGGRKLTKPLK
ncbi:hypothetical protein G6045_40695, partial [Streptomyces sp. YC504]